MELHEEIRNLIRMRSTIQLANLNFTRVFSHLDRNLVAKIYGTYFCTFVPRFWLYHFSCQKLQTGCRKLVLK